MEIKLLHTIEKVNYSVPLWVAVCNLLIAVRVKSLYNTLLKVVL